MTPYLLIATFLMATMTVVACKQPGLRGEQKNADAVSIVLPRKIQGQPPAVTSQVEIDPNSGRPKSVLVLRLDYFPEPEPGRTTLPACFRAFPGDFALGVAQCVQGGGPGDVAIYAKHVDQDCYTNPDSRRAKASEPLLMVGCQKAEVYAYSFDPRIRIDVEVR